MEEGRRRGGGEREGGGEGKEGTGERKRYSHRVGLPNGSQRPLRGPFSWRGAARGLHWGDFGCLGAFHTPPHPSLLVSALGRAVVDTVPHCGRVCLQVGHTLFAFGIEPVASGMLPCSGTHTKACSPPREDISFFFFL